MNNQFTQLAESQGFIHVFSPAETPQHNGFAERSNWTTLEKAQCLLSSSNLSNWYWAEAINTSTFLCNIVPTPSRHNLCPYVLWRGLPTRIKLLQTFGCQAIIAVPKHHREWKLAPAAKEGILLGYENNNTSYQILCIRDKKVFVAKHITFHKDVFPSLNNPTCLTEPLLIPSPAPEEAVAVDEVNTVESVATGDIPSN
ncbi:hypothetical protein O181_032147 [Austropuccinia psidii MF-1]|uniref:Integrase catalytic domain-containing protein n=1 Tax=Austropuccinia psidii MF-1 TaxID=1389203 RepID=A0A9Q3H603_9BASI|nr:hypothetical protein [Austropuccinia psidii MF-1]